MIFCFECSSIEDYKINEIDNKFSLGGDKFMLGIHLKQSGFTIVLLNHLLKAKNEFKRNMRCKKYLQKKFDKTYFQYDMAFGDF